ncbi:MAG: ATP-binding protein [Bacteroidales bacterium]
MRCRRVCFALLLPPIFLSAYSNIFSQDSNQKVKELSSLALEYEQKGDFNQAVYYFNRAATLSWDSNNLDDATANFANALANARKIGNSNGVKVICTNLGLINSCRGNHKVAAEYFSEALATARRANSKADIASALINLSSEQLELNDYALAEKSLTEAQGLAQEIKDQKLLKNCYLNLSKLYEKTGDQTKTSHYFNLFSMVSQKMQAEELREKEQKAKAMVDSAGRAVQQISEENEVANKRLVQTNQALIQKDNTLKEVKRITHEQQTQIALLNAEMQLRDAQLKHQHLLQRVYIGLIVISLLFALVIFYAYNEKRKANELLKEKNSEILRQKEEISVQADQLRELNAIKDKMFSIIAHDLRSPLFSLVNMLSIAKEGYFTEESFKLIIAELSINVNHTTSLLENLLTWAKNQMHGTKVNPVNFDLNSMVTSRIAVLQESAKKKGISIETKLSDNTSVNADKDMIEIVLRNIVSNSIKFCNEGDRICIWSTLKEDKITLCVEDSGVGIQPEMMGNLFGNQISSTLGTRDERGTGLGLIICKEFINMNGGKIWAESQVNRGSKFFFTLPAAKLN